MAKKKQIGRLIKTMRMSRNITQADLAKLIHQSQSSITMYETGRREPDFETLEALADVFNVPLSTLVDEDNYPRTLEARIVSYGMDHLPEEDRQKILHVIQAMYRNNPDFFTNEKGEPEDDPGF